MSDAEAMVTDCDRFIMCFLSFAHHYGRRPAWFGAECRYLGERRPEAGGSRRTYRVHALPDRRSSGRGRQRRLGDGAANQRHEWSGSGEHPADLVGLELGEPDVPVRALDDPVEDRNARRHPVGRDVRGLHLCRWPGQRGPGDLDDVVVSGRTLGSQLGILVDALCTHRSPARSKVRAPRITLACDLGTGVHRDDALEIDVRDVVAGLLREPQPAASWVGDDGDGSAVWGRGGELRDVAVLADPADLAELAGEADRAAIPPMLSLCGSAPSSWVSSTAPVRGSTRAI